MHKVLLLILLAIATPVAAGPPFATFDKASAAVLNDPHDLTIGPDGRLYVADKFGNRIVIMDPDTLEVLEIVGEGDLPGVHDISFGPDGKAYVAVTGASAVAIFDMVDGKLVFETAISPFPRTEGVLAHSNGQLYVMASGSGQLIAVDGTNIIGIATGMFGAHDVAEGLDGSVWVADTGRARLVRFSPELKELQVIDGPQYGFIGPRYLAVDDFGRLVVSDQDAHRVLLIDPVSGELLGVMGDGMPGIGPFKFDDPEGVEVWGNSYFFSDSDNNRIVKYVVVVN